jgi:hypothetical protein
MMDWAQLVHDRLRATGLNLSDSVIAELAAHLEETYELASSEGIAQPAAIKKAQQEIPDWSVLAQDIDRATSKEGPMNHRTRTLWIPGKVSLFGASLLMTLMQWSGMRPRLLWLGHMCMTFYWPWIAALPIFGALGAYLSRRVGGDLRTRLLAGLLPVLWLGLLGIVTMPLELAHQGLTLFSFGYFVLAMTNWVVIPGLALLAGTLPFLHFPGQRST